MKFYLNWLIKQFLQHIIYSNWVIGISAGVLCAGWTYSHGIDNWLLYGLSRLFATVAVYNFHRLYKLSSYDFRSPWLDWVDKNKNYLLVLMILSTLAALACFIYLIENVLPVLFCLGLTGAISLFYVVPVFGRNIREVPGIKSIVIAFVWVLVLFLLPVINEDQLTQKILPELIAYFFFFVALTIPFDIRDLKYDNPKQKTLPQVLGTETSKILATFLILAFTLSQIILKVQYFWNPLFLLASLLAIILILGTNQTRKEGYFALIDCVMILVGLGCFL